MPKLLQTLRPPLHLKLNRNSLAITRLAKKDSFAFFRDLQHPEDLNREHRSPSGGLTRPTELG